MYNQYKNAFTLAEVLITLTIIGIISTLTVPVIKNSYEQSYISTWKKAYSELSQTGIRIANEYGVETLEEALHEQQIMDEEEVSQITTQAAVNLFRKHLKLQAARCNGTCDGRTGWNCEGILVKSYKSGKTEYKYLSGQDAGYWVLGYHPTACFATGSYVFAIDTNTATYGRISVDVNGAKKPNVIGKDIFVLNMNNLRSVHPGGSKSFYTGVDYACNNTAKFGGPACSYEYLYK